MGAPLRFPKVHSPFEREETDEGHYVVTDTIADGYDWVFEVDDVLAIEKLHGTNCCVEVEQTEQGLNVTGYTRHGPEAMQEVQPFGTADHQLITRAFQNSLQRGYLDDLGEGVHYGEVVGPDFHQNAHELNENLFIPFQWLAEKCSYTSWGKYPKTFESLREWFDNQLFSLFYARMHGTDLKTASVRHGTFCEGIIFAHPDTSFQEEYLDPDEEHLSSGHYRKYNPWLAKLRRDMFEGFQRGEWPMTQYSNH